MFRIYWTTNEGRRGFAIVVGAEGRDALTRCLWDQYRAIPDKIEATQFCKTGTHNGG